MSRPLYETKEHLKGETEVVNTIEYLWKANLKKLPIKYKLDYAAERNGKIVAWVEIKCRTNGMNDYQTYMLSLDKYNASIELGNVTNLPVTLVVKWTDKTGYVDLLNCRGVIKMGGRIDREDPQDVEPVVFIPIQDFREITDESSHKR